MDIHSSKLLAWISISTGIKGAYWIIDNDFYCTIQFFIYRSSKVIALKGDNEE